MHSDLGLTIDLDQVRQIIAQSDVFAMGFRASPERLFVDTRRTATTGPSIHVVAPVASMQERMAWLSRERPAFGMPERFAFFFWPHSVRFLRDTGIWAAITDRTIAPGHPHTINDADLALAHLRRLERDATFAAITGEHHRTLWSR